VALRLQVNAKAVAEGRYRHEVFAELAEKGLAAVEAAARAQHRRGQLF
jgi:hypothetical protein